MYKSLFIVILCLSSQSCSGKIETPKTLRFLSSIPLPNVKGRIDHFAADQKKRRLFLSALGNNSVEVIDLTTNKVVSSITGLSEPQGIVFAESTNTLYIANGGDGNCNIYDGET